LLHGQRSRAPGRGSTFTIRLPKIVGSPPGSSNRHARCCTAEVRKWHKATDCCASPIRSLSEAQRTCLELVGARGSDTFDPNRTVVGYPCGAFRPRIWSLKGSTYAIPSCCQELRFRCPAANLSSNLLAPRNCASPSGTSLFLPETLMIRTRAPASGKPFGSTA
jgi:hypothetical protein